LRGKRVEMPRAGRVPIDVVRRWEAISEALDSVPLSPQRAAFVEKLEQLFKCAGEPTLQQVADWATAAQSAGACGSVSAAQRLVPRQKPAAAIRIHRADDRSADQQGDSDENPADNTRIV
jgi:hypothetical protein